jgi:hypothetical protein
MFSQLGEQNFLHLVDFHSRKFYLTEINYKIHDKKTFSHRGCFWGIDTPPSFLMDWIVSPKVKITKEGVRACSLVHITLGVHGRAKASGWGLGWLTNKSITHMDLHKPNNKLVNAKLKHFWCTNEPRANMDSQDSPRLRLRGNHHLPPYSILCAWPQGQHPNVILSWDSQVGVLKFPKLGH